ncbi:MAG: cation:proton antiporter [Anaerolineae bacterium]|nr:cation:proton antiporter [Anaerolineae bacterium]
MVTVGVTLLTGDFLLAVLLGVLATATAPAATVDVLEEYKADGPLTTSIVAVVGIDDALALLLYSIVVPLVESTFGQVAAPSLLTLLELPFIEIGGSILVGILLGLPLSYYVDRYCDDSAAQIAVIVGVVFLSTGLSRSLSLSLILTTMTLGTVVVNLASHGTACVRDTIEQASPVLYMLFFALVGARFRVQETFVDGLLLVLGAVQIVLRAVGKYGGAWLGALISGAERTVRDNIGMALLSQAGVAVGLALSINQRFSAYGGAAAALGAKVLTVITATTFVVQLVGPVLVKLAIARAGEIGQKEGAAAPEKVVPAD